MIAIGATTSALLVCALGSLFLYQHLYKTITETEHILILRREYGVDPLHTNIFVALQQAQEERRAKTTPDWSSAPNVFAKHLR